MLLYHTTTDDGKIGIEAEGFAVSHPNDSKGHAWFITEPRKDVATSKRDWWVIVELPADVAAKYLHRFDDGRPYGDNHLVPFEVVNACQPFRFEPWS